MKPTTMNAILTANATNAIATHTKFELPTTEQLKRVDLTKADLDNLCGAVKRAKARNANLKAQRIVFQPIAKLVGLDASDASDATLIDIILTATIGVYRNGQRVTNTKLRTDERKSGLTDEQLTPREYSTHFVENVSDATFTRAFMQVIAYVLVEQTDIIYKAQTEKELNHEKAMTAKLEKYKEKASRIAKEYPQLAITEKACIDNLTAYVQAVKTAYLEKLALDEKAKAEK